MSSVAREPERGRPLRVGLDLRLGAYRGGGIARYSEQLASALRTLDGIDLMPFYAVRDERAESGARLRTPPHHRLEEWTLPVEMLFHLARLDIFHSPDFVSPRLLKGVRVATVHDLAFHTWPGFLPPDALAYYNRIEHSRHWTDGWITPSRWTAEALRTAYDIPTERIEVIPHGVSPQLAEEPSLPLVEREGFILAVGTVEPRKNYDVLLDALQEMTNPPPFVVVGARGWQSESTQDRLRDARGVQWHDSASDATLKRLYRTATAVAVPSYAEGFGLAALEAMACGTPVISSGTGALPEVTGEVTLVPANLTAEDWAGAITRVLEDGDLWQALSCGGVKRAKQFTWEQAGRKTAAFYRRLLQA